MLVIAKSAEGHEFMYKASTAHKVSKASADMICKALNDIKYKLNPGEVWHVHEVSGYENAAIYAETQAFKRRNGKLIETRG